MEITKPTSTIFIGNALHALKRVADNSVHCAITSPPYFGLRNYNAEGQIGLEPTLNEYINNLIAVFKEVKRVLRPDGTFWLNVGDSWNGSGGSGGDYNKDGLRAGQPAYPRRYLNELKPKDMCGVPWRLAFALQEDGWWLRSTIIWHKNSMPEPGLDRPVRSYEFLFLLSKSPKYFYDRFAMEDIADNVPSSKRKNEFVDAMKNRRDVWIIPNRPSIWEFCLGCNSLYVGTERKALKQEEQLICTACGANDKWIKHFAAYPETLIEPIIRIGTSKAGCCSTCGAPHRRTVTKKDERHWCKRRKYQGKKWQLGTNPGNRRDGGGGLQTNIAPTGWQPSCKCVESEIIPCTVLDMFLGSGTTGIVAKKLKRNFIGIELNKQYALVAHYRIKRQQYGH